MKEEMLQELAGLPEIPRESAQVFHDHMNYLVDQVNGKMASRQDLSSLINGNELSLMYDSHRIHALFMDNIFQLSIYSLLLEVVPWFYRTYTNHGFSFDFFSTHLQAWKEALRENLDLDAIDPILRVYDWMLSHHSDFVNAAQDDTFSRMISSLPENETRDRFMQALLKGDRRTALEISGQEAVQPEDLERFYEETMKPAMYRIGEMWESGNVAVSEEHLASALGNMIVSSQYIRVMEDSKPVKGRILVTTASNEYHVLGAQMLANTLEADGWEVDFLGANTPSTDLVRYIEESSPDIVAISATMPFNLIHVQEVVGRIREEFQVKRPRIMLGGLAFMGQRDLVGHMGGDGYAENSSEAKDLAEQWRGEKDHATD